MNKQEVFHLTYIPEIVEQYFQAETRDKINFVVNNNKYTGAVIA